MNVVAVRGTLSRDPERRELADGSVVLAYELTVPRPGEKPESVPVAWTDPPAGGAKVVAGDEVVVVGRVRRRFFRAGGSTQSRTEVVANVVLKASQRGRIKAALEQVHQGVRDGAG